MTDRDTSSSDRPRPRLLALLALGLPWLLLAEGSGGGALEESLDRILRESRPGVVQVDVRRPLNLNLPREAVRPARGAPAVLRLQGNGVVWDARGHIVTDSDLAQPGDTLRVLDGDGGIHPAEYVGQIPEAGISLIRCALPRDMRPLPRSEASLSSDWAWALILGYSATSSSEQLRVARLRGGLMRDGSPRARLEGPIDSGLGGAGVLDGDGRLLGLVLGEGSESVLLRSSARNDSPVEYCMHVGGSVESGWVVPVRQIEDAVASLAAPEARPQGFLGVRVDLPAGGAPSGGSAGVTVAGVLPGSPAEEAGLRPGDRLVGFDGVPVTSWDDLTRRVALLDPGRFVRIDLRRAGAETAMRVRLGDRSHMIWREKQRRLADNREKMLRYQIEGLHQQLELLRHRIVSSR